MYYGNPVVAYNSTAIPYTLGPAGILLNNKNYPEIAEILHLVINDESIKNRLISCQRERLTHFKPSIVGALLDKFLANL